MADLANQRVLLLQANQEELGRSYIPAPNRPGFIIEVVSATAYGAGTDTVPAPNRPGFVIPIIPGVAFATDQVTAPVPSQSAGPAGQLDFSNAANSGLLPAL